MHKIDTETRTANDEFRDADPSQNIPPTGLNAAFFNTIQRELCNVVTGFGGTLSKDNDHQIVDVLKGLGFAVVLSTDGTASVPAGAKNVFIVCSARNLDIIGTLKNSMVFIVPLWSSDSVDSISVKNNGVSTELTIRKFSGFVGIAVNNGDDFFVGPMFPLSLSDRYAFGNITATSLEHTVAIDNGVIFDSNAAGPNGEYRPWQLFNNWKVGQVKRVRSIAVATKSYKMACYVSGAGTLGNVEFYPNSYREFLCVGSYTTPAGFVYAVLAVNGPESLTEEA